MIGMRKVLAISLAFILTVFTISLFACTTKSGGEQPTGPKIMVAQSGGAAKLIAQCSDRSYITQSADYVLECTVEKVEGRWNEEGTFIYTYTDLKINNYVKGTPLAQNEIQIVTPGGTVGEITQAVEDQPLFHEGKKVRVYLEEVNGRFVIVCGPNGIEEM
jgi:hypothetical protein